MKRLEIKKTVLEILDNLCSVDGFDDWLFELDDDMQGQIENELFSIINRRINKESTED